MAVLHNRNKKCKKCTISRKREKWSDEIYFIAGSKQREGGSVRRYLLTDIGPSLVRTKVDRAASV